MIKKSIMLIFCIIILSSIIAAQSYKLEISTIKETFAAGENITLKVSLYDPQNKPINADISVTLEDAEKRKEIQKTIQSNQFIDINLGEGATHGYWTITAVYQDVQASQLFIIEIEELVKFKLDGDELTITNIGNTKYTRTIQIIIGEISRIKEPEIDIGESVTYRLIAPDGTYNIEITDGKTTLTKNNVVLTGKVVGILDERVSERSGVTGGIRPDEEQGDFSYDYLKKSKFVYVFVIIIFGAMILLAIERGYQKRAGKKKARK